MVMQVAALDILTTKGRFAPEVARAIGEAMVLQIESSCEKLATNQRLSDVHVALKSEIGGSRMELEMKIQGVSVELDSAVAALNSRIDAARTELIAKIDAFRHEVDAKLSAMKAELVRWMFVALTGQTLVFAGLMRLFMPHGP